MIVEKENVIRDGVNCNFCDKGKLKESGIGLLYPYKTVFTLKREGSGLKASICKDCMDELIMKTDVLNKKFVHNKFCKDCINDVEDPQMCKFCDNGSRQTLPQ
jgi:hypothetical protein